MKQLKFLVQGSEEKPYAVVFTKKEDGELSATCQCRAAFSKKQCKHRVEILLGNPSAIVSDNRSEVEQVADWLKGSSLDLALAQWSEAAQKHEQTKKELTAAKAKLSRVLLG